MTNGDEKTIKLKVAEANHRDVGKGIVRIDEAFREKLGTADEFPEVFDEKIIETQTKIITSEITKDNENSNVEKLRISPLAKRIANEGNINYSNLKGTGPDGVIVKKDILNYINSSEQTVLLAEQEEREMKGFSEQIIEQRIPFVGIRKLTAKRMAESSNTTAAVTTFADVDMTAVKVYRKYIPVSYTTYVIKATIK